MKDGTATSDRMSECLLPCLVAFFSFFFLSRRDNEAVTDSRESGTQATSKHPIYKRLFAPLDSHSKKKKRERR